MKPVPAAAKGRVEEEVAARAAELHARREGQAARAKKLAEQRRAEQEARAAACARRAEADAKSSDALHRQELELLRHRVQTQADAGALVKQDWEKQVAAQHESARQSRRRAQEELQVAKGNETEQRAARSHKAYEERRARRLVQATERAEREQAAATQRREARQRRREEEDERQQRADEEALFRLQRQQREKERKVARAAVQRRSLEERRARIVDEKLQVARLQNESAMLSRTETQQAFRNGVRQSNGGYAGLYRSPSPTDAMVSVCSWDTQTTASPPWNKSAPEIPASERFTREGKAAEEGETEAVASVADSEAGEESVRADSPPAPSALADSRLPKKRTRSGNSTEQQTRPLLPRNPNLRPGLPQSQRKVSGDADLGETQDGSSSQCTKMDAWSTPEDGTTRECKVASHEIKPCAQPLFTIGIRDLLSKRACVQALVVTEAGPSARTEYMRALRSRCGDGACRSRLAASQSSAAASDDIGGADTIKRSRQTGRLVRIAADADASGGPAQRPTAPLGPWPEVRYSICAFLPCQPVSLALWLQGAGERRHLPICSH